MNNVTRFAFAIILILGLAIGCSNSGNPSVPSVNPQDVRSITSEAGSSNQYLWSYNLIAATGFSMGTSPGLRSKNRSPS